jgi:predicted AlkP superfamily pyrophosphatase or phosphodiesterase
VLVSLDGFRWDYVDRPPAVTLRALARKGVRAEGLVPVFPSKTFTNHYTLVTGLGPGRSGVLANNFRDPGLGDFSYRDTAAVRDPRWWTRHWRGRCGGSIRSDWRPGPIS